MNSWFIPFRLSSNDLRPNRNGDIIVARGRFYSTDGPTRGGPIYPPRSNTMQDYQTEINDLDAKIQETREEIAKLTTLNTVYHEKRALLVRCRDLVEVAQRNRRLAVIYGQKIVEIKAFTDLDKPIPAPNSHKSIGPKARLKVIRELIEALEAEQLNPPEMP